MNESMHKAPQHKMILPCFSSLDDLSFVLSFGALFLNSWLVGLDERFSFVLTSSTKVSLGLVFIAFSRGSPGALRGQYDTSRCMTLYLVSGRLVCSPSTYNLSQRPSVLLYVLTLSHNPERGYVNGLGGRKTKICDVQFMLKSSGAGGLSKETSLTD